MIPEASAIFASLKATIEIVRGLKSSYDASTITQVQSDILDQLLTTQMDALTLQEKHLAVINEKEELAKKLVQFEQWEKIESEYELKEIRPGMLVYSSKNYQQSKIPTHWLCTQCWEDRKKSILQASQHNESGGVYVCPRCNLTIRYYGALEP